MRKILILVLLALAGTAQALDPYRIIKSTQTVAISSSLTATSLFVDSGVAHVACTATCWVAVHSTNVETVVAAVASQMVMNDQTAQLAIPASRYLIFRRDSVDGKAYVTELEAAR
jgi:hypothetical protein